MKFSTKGRYALRMMLEFALHPDECTKIIEVSQRQDISDKYLEQIVTILSKAGFVKSRRGAQGGYYLARPASEYTVGMILRLAEGSLVPVSCVDEEENPCGRADICATLMVWKKLDEAISGVVDSITLSDLAEEQKRLDQIAFEHKVQNKG